MADRTARRLLYGTWAFIAVAAAIGAAPELVTGKFDLLSTKKLVVGDLKDGSPHIVIEASDAGAGFVLFDKNGKRRATLSLRTSDDQLRFTLKSDKEADRVRLEAVENGGGVFIFNGDNSAKVGFTVDANEVQAVF